uniref:Glycosyltransferase n=1 Tax=Tanacetum cinerariifolium TaxID=118510 RepID=A0A6L2KMQ1_TANCI|nr:zeatin O-xylosyltransferase-like [Tanacetum cinerariifolium]
MGPFNPVSISNSENPGKRHKSLQWLDKHDQDSVIYVSFGTTTSLSNEQIQELAIGLEKSGQKFIWVLRDADKGDIFEGEARRVELPKGFEERLEEKGLIVREWVPQLEILAHPATGGFMSHCGWNSSMESITMGVPIAAWPMHSDQPRNARLLIDVLKIGISIRDWSDRGKLVTSSTIDTAIQNLMASGEGNEIRKRAAKLGVDVRRSVEEGVLTLKNIPQKAAAGGSHVGIRSTPYKIPLPNTLISSPQACLIIDDRLNSNLTSKQAKEKIRADAVPVSKVIKLSKLKSSYKPFEAKRKLCDSYDVFFADKRVVPFLPKLLGNCFFRSKKLPLGVDLSHKNWKEQIERGFKAGLLSFGRGTCSVVRVARVGMDKGEIVKNVNAGVEGVLGFVPKKILGVRSLHLKFSGVGAENLRRMGQEKIQLGCNVDTSMDMNHESDNFLNFPIFPATNEFSSICEQDVDLEREVAEVEDDDDGDTYDIWDITVEDVERIRQLLMPNFPDEIDEVIQHLIPQPIHTTPPNDDYITPATKSILDE